MWYYTLYFLREFLTVSFVFSSAFLSGPLLPPPPGGDVINGRPLGLEPGGFGLGLGLVTSGLGLGLAL